MERNGRDRSGKDRKGKDRQGDIMTDGQGLIIEKVQPMMQGLKGRYIKHTYKAKEYDYNDVLKELQVDVV